MVKVVKKDTKKASANDLLNEKLAKYKLSNVLGLVNEFHSAHAVFTSTGIPSFDSLLGKGMVNSRDIEIYSKDGSACKTTIALMVAAFWQSIGKLVAIVDVEGTMTEDYLNLLGVITEEDKCPDGVAAVRMISHKKNPDGTAHILSLQEVFDSVRACGDIFDLIIVDSVDALMEKSEADKSADENAKQGGISKRMSEFMRKNVARNATIIWLNQTRQSMAYNPTGNVTYVGSGGRALRFYSSVRVELQMIKKLQEGDKDPWGFTIEARTVKNKLGAQWRKCELTYIFGEGISIVYDYFKVAMAKGMILKSGSWFDAPDLGIKAQGEKKLYEKLKANEGGCFDKLKSLVDGEDIVQVDEVPEELRVQEIEEAEGVEG